MDDIGYELTRFPGAVAQQTNQFLCCICTLVVRAPRECTSCGSLFCSICIEQWLLDSKECPKRKCDLVKNPLKKISGALLMMYNNMDIKCKFPSCSAVKKLCEIENHENNCQATKCINFEVCGNSVKQELKDLKVCDLSCLLLSKVKPNYGNWTVMQNEIRAFIKTHLNPGEISKRSSLQTKTGDSNLTSFKWDRMNIGTNIEVTEGDTKVFLKESAYMFRTVIGDQGFMNGIKYWELVADNRSENELKIGVSRNKEFNYNSAFCDYEFGFAYYGVGQLRQNSNSVGQNYGKKFKQSGVLGICLNMNKGTLSFALDGDYWGVAYQSELLKQGPIYPAVSLLHCAGCKLVTGKPVPGYFNE